MPVGLTHEQVLKKHGEPLRQKEKKFVIAYTDINSNTYQNGTRSAIFAGYTSKTVESTASHLLKRDRVKKEISRIEQELSKRYADTLENKIKIAWEMFIKHKEEGQSLLAHRWYEEHGKLSRHYTIQIDQKIEQKVINKEEAKEMATRLQRLGIEPLENKSN